MAKNQEGHRVVGQVITRSGIKKKPIEVTETTWVKVTSGKGDAVLKHLPEGKSLTD